MGAPRKHPLELRERAVRLALESGRPIRQVARDLGIHHESLRVWVRQAQADSGRRRDLLTSEERDELKRLRGGVLADLSREVKIKGTYSRTRERTVMQIESEDLRAALHSAVDEVFDRIATGAARKAFDDLVKLMDGPIVGLVGSEGEHGDFNFVWPDLNEEYFERARAYSIRTASRATQAVIGETIRQAWGKDRRRVVVFERITDEPARWYPWTEFVETDDGRFSATVPDANRPRAALKDGDPLPQGYEQMQVARADELFDAIREGPSLRVVVDRKDEEAMVRHAYYVPRLRGRVQ